MDKFENEEKFGFYYESDQDSHLSDSDWTPSESETEESSFEESDCTNEEESEEDI